MLLQQEQIMNETRWRRKWN